MLDEMQYFREKKFFCDITIVVGDKEIEVSETAIKNIFKIFMCEQNIFGMQIFSPPMHNVHNIWWDKYKQLHFLLLLRHTE